MKTKTNQAHDESKDAFVARVAGLWPVAKGSLAQTRSPCTRKNCKACVSGRKHPKMLYTFREEGRLRGMYVRPFHAQQVRRTIENGRELEKLLATAGRDLVLRLRQEM